MCHDSIESAIMRQSLNFNWVHYSGVFFPQCDMGDTIGANFSAAIGAELGNKSSRSGIPAWSQGTKSRIAPPKEILKIRYNCRSLNLSQSPALTYSLTIAPTLSSSR
jgi:hypothetical protein